ncbi:BLUF domain-containing protein [Novosphingobium sp. BL-52-GroH]|uniref:BLUF domain-containing protein n=1 Tax=Novosphingobium sp. BL-52-GroH TaxID=3349877 RepID=UPI00384DD06C
MAMTAWLYASRSRLLPETAGAEIEHLVAMAHERNARLDVTGALLYTGNRFAQYIEGPTASVDALRASIHRDPRHDDITTIEMGIPQSRLFGSWSLAFGRRSQYFEGLIEKALQDFLSGSPDGHRPLMRLLKECAS